MSYWNHRIMAHKYKDQIYLKIHEVYYDETDAPNSCTLEGVNIGSESVEGLRWQLEHMLSCLNEPIIWYGEKFPEVYNEE